MYTASALSCDPLTGEETPLSQPAALSVLIVSAHVAGAPTWEAKQLMNQEPEHSGPFAATLNLPYGGTDPDATACSC